MRTCTLTAAIMICCLTVPSFARQIIGSYDITDVDDVLVPWQSSITAFVGTCNGSEIAIATSSGGLWRSTDDSTFVFDELVFPAHNMAAVDETTGDFAFYIGDRVEIWSEGTRSKSITVVPSVYQQLHFIGRSIVLVDDNYVTRINLVDGVTKRVRVDVNKGVSFSGNRVAYTRNDSLFIGSVTLDSADFTFFSGLSTLVGLEGDIAALYSADSIELVGRNGRIANYYFPYNHRSLRAYWDSLTMVVIGSDTSVVNRLYQIDLTDYMLGSLGAVEGYTHIVIQMKKCNTLYIMSDPTSIRKYERQLNGRYALMYQHTCQYAAMLSVVSEMDTIARVIVVVDEPSMPNGGRKVYSEVVVDTAGNSLKTMMFARQDQGEYPQIVLKSRSQHQYLVTNKRICTTSGDGVTLWASPLTVTSACISGDVIHVGTLSGIYTVNCTTGQVDTIDTVDSYQYVPIHLSSDPVSGDVLVVESSTLANPKRRHRLIRRSAVSLLSVQISELYSASFIFDGHVLLIGQRTVGADRVTSIQRGSLLNGMYLFSDSIQVPFPVSPQSSDLNGVYSIGSAYRSIALQYQGPIYRQYDMAGDNPFTLGFITCSQPVENVQLFGINFSGAPRLVRVRLSDAVTTVNSSDPRQNSTESRLKLILRGNDIVLTSDGVDAPGRIMAMTIRGSCIAEVDGGKFALSNLSAWSDNMVILVAEYQNERCVLKWLLN